MKLIERSEILGIGDYETIRTHFRTRVVESKRARRVALGGEISVLFENRDTVLLQIQEMLRTERITAEPAIAHEIATYNELVPLDGELSATLFIEIPDTARREEMQLRLCAIEEHVVFEIETASGVERCRATFEEGRRDRGRAAAVQYLKFPLSRPAMAALVERRSAALVVDHPNFAARFPLNGATVASLAGDLA